MYPWTNHTYSIKIVFGSRYSMSPFFPDSRPNPLCLKPPNGVLMVGIVPLLMLTVPALSSELIRMARTMSLVKTLAGG